MEDRLEQLRKYLNNQCITQESIARRFGISKQAVNQLLTGRKPFGKLNAQRWAKEFGLSASWLLTGEGEMLNVANVAKKKDGVPCYTQEKIECGRPSGFGDVLMEGSAEEVLSFPGLKNDGRTFAVQVHGDSMINHKDPDRSIPNGAWVALRRSEMSTIRWGEVYALATTDGFIIKKLMPSESDNNVRCVSFNGEEYPPFELSKSEIYDYATVAAVISARLW